MVLTKLGLHFRRDGDRWRCVEWPGLVMLNRGRYEVDEQGFDRPLDAAAGDPAPSERS